MVKKNARTTFVRSSVPSMAASRSKPIRRARFISRSHCLDKSSETPQSRSKTELNHTMKTRPIVSMEEYSILKLALSMKATRILT